VKNARIYGANLVDIRKVVKSQKGVTNWLLGIFEQHYYFSSLNVRDSLHTLTMNRSLHIISEFWKRVSTVGMVGMRKAILCPVFLGPARKDWSGVYKGEKRPLFGVSDWSYCQSVSSRQTLDDRVPFVLLHNCTFYKGATHPLVY